MIGVRWTVGPASANGFEALNLSVQGAARLFGPAARYAVCVNGLEPEEAHRRTGALPVSVEWRRSADLPGFLADRLGPGMAEGVAWKFAPLRLFPEWHELALDNDCILWEMPDALAAWLRRDDACVLAEDVRQSTGQFAALCGDRPMNCGLRALPPRFDLAARLRAALARHPVALVSELDEQGLQIAALSLEGPPDLVRLDEVTICSPFPPHLSELGRGGAHFVGLNVRDSPWSAGGQPATAWIDEHWRRHRPAIARALGLGAAWRGKRLSGITLGRRRTRGRASR